MKFIPTSLEDAYIIELKPFQDERGLFARTYCKKEFATIGHTEDFVQINHSRTIPRAAIRGMHFQVPPSAETKLIRVIRGTILDVIVDIRRDSPTFLQHIKVELSEENMRMIYVPKGFAHGFQTLTTYCEMIYHHTEFYTPENERGLRFDDPVLNIDWPYEPSIVSNRDQNHPLIELAFEGIMA